MKDHLIDIMKRTPNEQKKNLTREYLQIYMLRLVHEAGANVGLAFLGGTALRLLHHLPRFSEDLDFALISAENARYLDTKILFHEMKSALERAGYTVIVAVKAERTISNVFFRFGGLPMEIGWSRDPRQKLSVKMEIDQNPPTGADVVTTLIQRFYPIALQHYDLPSLFAGKIHALLTRPYQKGRDWFDLVFYLTEHRGLEPNLNFLEQALKQTGTSSSRAIHWREDVAVRLSTLDWNRILSDLKPFVERQSDLVHMTPQLILQLLKNSQ